MIKHDSVLCQIPEELVFLHAQTAYTGSLTTSGKNAKIENAEGADINHLGVHMNEPPHLITSYNKCITNGKENDYNSDNATGDNDRNFGDDVYTQI